MTLETDRFHEFLNTLYNSQKPCALDKFRGEAWAKFQTLGLPSKKNEVFRYVKLKNLFSESFTHSVQPNTTREMIAPYIYPECRQSVLVFVNGCYKQELSNSSNIPGRVVITPLNDALNTYGAFLDNQLKKSMKTEKDPFAMINTSLHPEGLFIYIPPNSSIDVPMQILHVLDGDTPFVAMPRIHLFAGKSSSINLHFSQNSENIPSAFVNSTIEMTIEQNASVNCTQNLTSQKEALWHFDALRAVLKQDARLKTVSITDGSRTIRQDYHVALSGANGEVMLNGLWNLEKNNEAHTNIMIDHQAPNCTSHQLFKGILKDSSRSSFEGKIYVRQAAQKTDAFQLNQNLLLSEGASAHAKPNLEIFADDVKASHGATVGQLDQEQLFYMKSRGFTDVLAKKELVRGFCREIIDMIALDSIKNETEARWFKNE